jgi:hypothetical protein
VALVDTIRREAAIVARPAGAENPPSFAGWLP